MLDDNVAFAQSIKNISIKDKSLSALTHPFMYSLFYVEFYFIEKTLLFLETRSGSCFSLAIPYWKSI